MVAFPLCSGTPGVRLGLALLASLCLHGALLLPTRWPARVTAPPQPPLAVVLPAPEPPPAPPPAATAPPPSPQASAGAVSPELTFGRPAPPPRELRGRALSAALEALAREEFYPRAAIARGLEGRVVLLLTLDGGGRLTGIEVASSSGHALLDDAALKAATRIGRLGVGQRQVLLPVEFRLE